jgi:hypothetical protein
MMASISGRGSSSPIVSGVRGACLHQRAGSRGRGKCEAMWARRARGRVVSVLTTRGWQARSATEAHGSVSRRERETSGRRPSSCRSVHEQQQGGREVLSPCRFQERKTREETRELGMQM